jgi:hypothetical protein
VTKVQYDGPHEGVDVDYAGTVYTVARGGSVEVPKDLATELLARPDWSEPTQTAPARGEKG